MVNREPARNVVQEMRSCQRHIHLALVTGGHCLVQAESGMILSGPFANEGLHSHSDDKGALECPCFRVSIFAVHC